MVLNEINMKHLAQQDKLIKKFYKEFQERMSMVTQLNKSNPLIYVINLPASIPNYQRLELIIQYYRKVFFRMLFIRILEEWKALPLDPIGYILNEADESDYPEKFNQLFFEIFNRKKNQREEALFTKTKELLDLPHLNGGLFRRSVIEKRYNLKLSPGSYKNIWEMLIQYKFAGNGAEKNFINLEVMGYIFERTIDASGGNQKDSGSYYTDTKLTKYISKNTIRPYLLDKLTQWAHTERVILTNRKFTIFDFQAFNDEQRAKIYDKLFELLRNLKICDIAVGSGAFLKEIANELIEIYHSLYYQLGYNWIPILKDPPLDLVQPFQDIYSIKQHILQYNIYGVDIDPNAVEVCQLRLWLWLIHPPESDHIDFDLEALTKIDFNIRKGNSLIGFIQYPEISEEVFADVSDIETMSDIRKTRLELIKKYYTDKLDSEEVKNEIDEINLEINKRLHKSYYQDRIHRTIKKKATTELFLKNKPFHWCFEFEEIMNNGGFDILVGNPPWNAIKPVPKEYYAQFDEELTKKNIKQTDIDVLRENMDIKEGFESYKEMIEAEAAIYKGYLNKKSAQELRPYYHQADIILNNTISGDLNYYKLFAERFYQLGKENAIFGLIIPSAFYSDGGSKALRKLYLDNACIEKMIGFENSRAIFQNVHRSYRFVILIGNKMEETGKLLGTFMHNDLSILNDLDDNLISIDWEAIKKIISPESYSIPEIKTKKDKEIIDKLFQHPLILKNPDWLGKVKLRTEFHMTNGKKYFNNEGQGLYLYEGKMIEQYTPYFNNVFRYWVEENKGKRKIYKGKPASFDYDEYRLAFRAIAASTNRRTMIASLLPKRVFTGNSLVVIKIYEQDNRLITEKMILYLCAVFNSTIFDYLLRMRVFNNLNLFFIYQMPIPKPDNASLTSIITNVIKLTENWADFKDLRNGEAGNVLTKQKRLELIAEIDIAIAKLYGLSKDDMIYILDTFHHKYIETEKELRALEKEILKNF